MVNVIADTHDGLTRSDRQRFRALVVEGGEITGPGLDTNIAGARILVMVRDKDDIRGVGALKRPQGSYRVKVETKSGVPLAQADYPYELGYIFLEDALRGQGASHDLVNAALAHSDGGGVFATVRMDNARMRATFEKAGFTPAGKSWEGQEKRQIGLLIRPAGNGAA